MVLRVVLFALAVAGVAPQTMAQTAPLTPPPAAPSATTGDIAAQVSALGETMMIGEMIEVMRAEGLEYGSTLEAEMFPGAGGAAWQATVGIIYDPTEMRRLFDVTVAKGLAQDNATLAEAQAFFGDERGQNILRLELEARRALMDDATEEAAKEALALMEMEGDPRLEVLYTFAATNDLVEMNVMGALNANLAFYKGLQDGGGFEDPMSEDEMLADVWSQETDIRLETNGWLFAYLSLAYQPLSTDDMAAYQAFSESAAGKRLNAVIFAGFDAVFTRISYDLGRAAAKQMQGEDI